MSDVRTPQEVVASLDAYFERVGAAVASRSGEVLKFVGDAMLAIFPVGGSVSARDACARALDAADDALRAMAALNAERAPAGLPALEIGVALHRGRVLYGNIGARERLDFTVIGASVNEVCRLESLCKPLGVALVASSEFARACESARLVSAGSHALKGVGRPIEVFRLGLGEE
jgi:adenylate cyclase